MKVSRFTTKRSRAKNTFLLIFIVQLSPRSEINNLLKTKFLNYYAIKWGEKNGITKCHKCQLLGHTSQIRNLNYRCVKCNEPHNPGECKITKNSITNKDQIYCANCKSYGHPALYLRCPKLVEFKKNFLARINKSKEASSNRIAQMSRKINPELTFSDIMKQGKNQFPTLKTQQ